MSEHHHHHKHKRDYSSTFKHKSLAAIRRKKLFEKILKIVMVIVAILMVIAVCLAYTIG